MPDMLEQAIIDAEALKEAAVKNAETLVLEKYSNQIKEAVDSRRFGRRPWNSKPRRSA